MAIERPSTAEIVDYAENFGITLSDSEVNEFALAIDGTLASYDAVDELYEKIAPQAPKRQYQFPNPQNNALGAWYVTCNITDEDSPSDKLRGKRIAIKDNVAVAGIPMMNGSRSVEGYVPSEDATVVARMLAAGATIAGKSVCEDLCFSGSSFTSASGSVKNPRDTSREAGGSSSGSAALVASGEVDMALGGDQGGSIRMPAAFCGIVGHKPTHGLVPYTGGFPIERTIDHLGPMSSTVEDAALLLSVIAGSDGKDPRQGVAPDSLDFLSQLHDGIEGLKVGVVAEGFGQDNSDSAVDNTVREALTYFVESGATVEEVSIPEHRDAMDVWNVIATDGGSYQMMEGNGYGLNADGYYDPAQMEFFAAKRLEHANELAHTVQATAIAGRHGLKALGGSSYAKARNLVPLIRKAYDNVLKKVDVLVMPTVPYLAKRLPEGNLRPTETITAALGMLTNTAPLDVTGHPALTVPAGLSDGLPVGLMIIGKHFDDATVLRVGQAFEQTRGELREVSVR